MLDQTLKWLNEMSVHEAVGAVCRPARLEGDCGGLSAVRTRMRGPSEPLWPWSNWYQLFTIENRVVFVLVLIWEPGTRHIIHVLCLE
jgi:hypothetical protein